ncbi:MAG: hypothetical protein DRQ24_11225 [Candidatus Latescibacterota bacterium]|nr:MAG: hypothetical protein DRQ24_11225 [Candidatus Latescibacterota bacterium]
MPVTILIAIVAAAIFASAGYLKSSGTENFDATKFSATVLVGAIVGVVMYFGGVPVTEANVIEQLAAYAGIVAVVENILKAIIRRL